MIQDIAYTLIFGWPLIMYGGITALVLLVLTAVIGIMNYRGIFTVPFKWHMRIAAATLVVAIIHGMFGLSVYFNF